MKAAEEAAQNGSIPSDVDLAGLLAGVMGGGATGTGKKGGSDDGCGIPGMEGVKTKDLMQQADVMWRHLDELSSKDPSAYRSFLEKAAKDAGMEGKIPMPGARPPPPKPAGPSSDRIVEMGPGAEVPSGLKSRPGIVLAGLPFRHRDDPGTVLEAGIEYWADVSGKMKELTASDGKTKITASSKGEDLRDLKHCDFIIKEQPVDVDVPADDKQTGGGGLTQQQACKKQRRFKVVTHLSVLRACGCNDDVMRICVDRARKVLEKTFQVEFRPGEMLRVFKDPMVVPTAQYMKHQAQQKNRVQQEQVREAARDAGIHLPNSLVSELAGLGMTAELGRPGEMKLPPVGRSSGNGRVSPPSAVVQGPTKPLIQVVDNEEETMTQRLTYQVTEKEGVLEIVFKLPGAKSMEGLDLEAAPDVVVLDATGIGLGKATVDLGTKRVDEDGIKAKFSSKKEELKVTLPLL